MKPKKTKHSNQEDLFRHRLANIINLDHPLCRLSHQIDWGYYEEKFSAHYSDKGRCGKPTRLLISLHLLKHMFNESDESVVERFIENPYWQYFAGFEYFQHDLPLDPTSMVKWRNRIGSEGVKEIFNMTVNTAQNKGLIKKSHMNKINVDTTVQEKAIAFPTDVKLYYKMVQKLAKTAQRHGIKLRQSYIRVSKKILIKQSRYAHAKQYRRAGRETNKLKTILGRVVRDITRKSETAYPLLQELLYLANRLLDQSKHSKNKLYSIHEPHVECISKGKAHKRYEFGCKVSVASTSRDNWIIGVKAHHGNPYDGHTLAEVMTEIEESTGMTPKKAYCDRGYRGHNYEGSCEVIIVGKSAGRKKLSYWDRKWQRRRSAIEPVIGHMKHDNRMDRNYLRGVEGDKINALLAAAGANMRKLYLAFFLRLLNWTENLVLPRNIFTRFSKNTMTSAA